ncbi:MAG: hypothetical protein K2X46_02840 [Roseomonas sp.]|nr:hypothetical protein [Roseomonas sp.]
MSEASADVKDAKGVVCVLDLGEHSRKRVRRLRRGEGKLMDKVEDAIAALHDEGVLDATVQTVVVVVRQEQRLGDMFRDDDDDDDDD